MTTPLDEGMAKFSAALAASTPPGFETWPLDKQRASWNAVCARFRAERPAGLDVSEVVANGVACRLYKPSTARPKAGILYGHGGGWVLGGPETHDDICAELAAQTGCVVVLVDYRLAPEHPHPAQNADMFSVWQWMRDNAKALAIDPAKIIAAGDSAGGQLSAALALKLRDEKLPQLAGMVLAYPALGADLNSPSYLRNANAPSLSRAEMMFYLRAFLGEEGGAAWRDERALPLLAKSMAGLPPAFITVAAHDPLYDDGVIFHQRLVEAGGKSELRREPALGHSYMRARHNSLPAMESFKAIIGAVKAMAD